MSLTKSAKDEVRELLDKMPEEASFEDIQCHIYVLQKVRNGLKATGGGRLILQAEMEKWPLLPSLEEPSAGKPYAGDCTGGAG